MFKYTVAVICAALALSGCATPAKVGAMVGMPTIMAPADTPLKKSVAIEVVSGGEATNPLWTSQVSTPDFQEALRESLDGQGFLGGDTARFKLDATLMELKQPLIGFDMTVTSTVHYVITDTMNKHKALDETVTASYTATVNDAFVGVERLRLANEGSIKTNISNFLDKLIREDGMGGMTVSQIRIRIDGTKG